VTGTIKRLVTDHGYGFITADDGTAYFFHRSDLVGGTAGFDDLVERDAVRFEPVEPAPAKGKRASQVQRVASAGELHSPGESNA
jgi:cold shock CspA family protein